jgi:hypothetical protein
MDPGGQPSDKLITFQVEKGYTIDQLADWAGTSARMIIDVHRHKLADVTDLGPAV